MIQGNSVARSEQNNTSSMICKVKSAHARGVPASATDSHNVPVVRETSFAAIINTMVDAANVLFTEDHEKGKDVKTKKGKGKRKKEIKKEKMEKYKKEKKKGKSESSRPPRKGSAIALMSFDGNEEYEI